MIYQKHPQHGIHIAYTTIEANYNHSHGWVDIDINEEIRAQREKTKVSKTVTESPQPETGEETPQETDEDHQEAIDAYQLKFGKKPHHRMGTETILKAINDNGE